SPLPHVAIWTVLPVAARGRRVVAVTIVHGRQRMLLPVIVEVARVVAKLIVTVRLVAQRGDVAVMNALIVSVVSVREVAVGPATVDAHIAFVSTTRRVIVPARSILAVVGFAGELA